MIELHKLSEKRVPDIVALAGKLVSQCRDEPTYDPEIAAMTALSGLSNPQWFGCLAYLMSQPVGFIIGTYSAPLFSRVRRGYLEHIYVEEDTPSRAKVGKLLHNALEHWALIENRCVNLQMAENSGINPQAVDAFYRSLGYRIAGAIYMKDAR